MTTIFVTGTDTEIGKTWVTSELLRAGRAAGLNWVGFKPIAAGADMTAEGLRNEDALHLRAAAPTSQPYAITNPICLEHPVAPHLAAARAGQPLDWHKVMQAHARLVDTHDLVLAEGAGGWQVPVTETTTLADHVAEEGWPVLLVVGMRLGCINHALLSAESITRRCRLLGWIANCLPPEQPMLAENIETLRQRMPAPLLGTILSENPDAAEVLQALRRELAAGH